jgi:hypothetical protein
LAASGESRFIRRITARHITVLLEENTNGKSKI